VGHNHRLHRSIIVDEIAERAQTDTFDCPFHFTKRNGERVLVEDGKLIPDPMFGIRYPDKSARIFLPEDDCKTERMWSDKIDVESWQHKLEKHYAFIGKRQPNGSKLYHKYFDPKVRLMSLFLFSDIGRMKAVMKMLYEMTEGRGSKFMLFQSWTDFGRILRVPDTRPDLFDGLYYRVGYDPFNISLVDGGVKE